MNLLQIFLINDINLMFSSDLRYKLIDSSINNPSEHFSILAKLFEYSEFFVSAEKCRRLAIGYCVAILL